MTDAELAFQQQKWAEERQLREAELDQKRAERRSPWTSPIIVAVIAAGAAATGNIFVTRENGRAQQELERVKAEQALIIEAIKTGGNTEAATANLQFLTEVGLVTDKQRAEAIRSYIARNRDRPDKLPSLPTAGGAGNPETSVTERARRLAERVKPAGSAVAAPVCARPAGARFCIADHLLIGPGDKPVEIIDAAHRGARLKSTAVIVMHFTAGPDRAATRIFSQANLPMTASSHVEINRDGSLTQLVPFDVAAFHVGRSRWKALDNLNSHSIGIEMANWGRLQRGATGWTTRSGVPVPAARVYEQRNPQTGAVTGWERYTPAQLETADAVVRALAAAYPTITDVVGHDQVSLPAGRKDDPGPALPLERFKAMVARR